MHRNIRFIACVILLLGVVTYSSAQEFKPQLTLGGRVGATASFMIFSPNVGQGAIFAPNAGVVFRYVSEKYFGRQAEVNYDQKGWSEPLNNYSRRLNYLEIPFLTHITFGRKMCKGFVNLGPNIAYMLSDKIYGNNLQGSSQPQQTLPVKNHFDYGICAGLGFEVQTKKAGIYQIEARYNYGLGDIFSSASSSPIRVSSNQNISLNFAVLFPLK